MAKDLDTDPVNGLTLHRPPFARIACAIDGSRGSHVAAGQASALAGHDGTVTFIAVCDVAGVGPTRVSTLSEHRAKEALQVAVRDARDAGAMADSLLLHGGSPVESLLSAAAGYDLLVLGTHPHSRIAGIVLGDTASTIVHRAGLSVLVARVEPIASGVIAASDARPRTRPAITAATHIAARAGAPLTLLHVERTAGSTTVGELEAELANARALLGRDARLIVEAGHPADRIVAAAERKSAGLIVLGSELKTGLAALGSIGERVAHTAPCSVLIKRDPAG